MKTLIKTIVLICLFAIPSFAQDNEKAAGDNTAQANQQFEEAEELYAFLDDHFPGMNDKLDAVLKNEGQMAYDTLRELQVEILKHYHRVLGPFGEEMAMLVIRRNKLNPKVQALLDRYEALALDDPARAKARADAEPVLAISNTFDGEWAKQRLLLLKKNDSPKAAKQIAAQEKKVKEMDALRAQPKKVFDDYIVYRKSEVEAAEKAIKKLPAYWHTDPKEALAAAKKSGKQIHIFFSVAWWDGCLVMIDKVFPKEEVKEALKDYEPLYIDAALQGDFARKYHIARFPRSIIIDAEGKFLHRTPIGTMNADEFIEWLKTKK